MESATLLLLASGMGVLFGWQPMPDGSPRYEYVVQLEPELVATLEEGQSIPISVDIPEDIHPIGRIRIVVGREPLPHRQLATNFKPWPVVLEKESREGVLETQYTVPSAASQEILPPSNAASDTDPYSSQILPPQDDQGIVGSVQEGARKLGNQLRSVGESVRIDTHLLFGRPQREQSIFSTRQIDSQTILPPGSAVPQQHVILPPADDWQAPAWDNSQPITPGNDSQSIFGQNTTPVQSTTSTLEPFDAPWSLLPRPDDPSQVTEENQSAPFSEQPLNWPNNTPSDRYDVANLPTASDSSTSNESGERYDSNNNWPSESSFPVSANHSHHLVSDALSSQETEGTTDSSGPSATSSAPEIRRDMLDHPADAELQMASRPPAISTFDQVPPQSPDRQPQASDFGWDKASSTAANEASARKDAPPRSLFPLILSWVLLSGSVAGNGYLFWSFLDVRSKYRGLVHNTHSSGNRYPGN